MRDWRVKGRDKLDFRASADSIKYHGMYENEPGGYRSSCRNTLYIRFKFEIDGIGDEAEGLRDNNSIRSQIHDKPKINGGETQHPT